MKSKVGKPLEQIKDEMTAAIKSQDLGDEDDIMEFEFMNEMNAQELLYSQLSPEEVERWKFIKVLLQKRDNERIKKYNYFKSEETDRVESYYKASLMSPGKFEEYLISEIQKLDLKITKYSFGRELLEHYTEEKFLLLFNDSNHYKPLNLRICEIDEGKDEREVKDKLIKLFAKERALLEVLTKLEVPKETDATSTGQDNKKKPGRKKTIVSESFSLKDVATPEQIEVIMKLLLDNKYIHEIDGIYFISDNKYTNRFASIIKALPKYNYCSSLTSEQAFYILKNDFKVDTTQNTVNQAKDTKALSIFNLKR